MKDKFISRGMLLLGAMLTLVFLMPFSSLTAQQTPESNEQMLGLGDEITDSLEPGERTHYTLNIEDTAEPFDIVLFSTVDSVMNISDGEGLCIRTVNYMRGYGYEVFTWEPGDTMPVEIVVYYIGNSTEEYTLSILPTELPISEEPVPGEQVKRWAEFAVEDNGSSETVTLPYLLYTPEDYDENQQYPFILFMHGAGEIGPRLDILKDQVIPKLIEDGEDYPFIIASPQLNYGQFWDEEPDLVANFIVQLQSEFPIDPDRIYITGLSLGGSGAWHFALAYPEVPAAVVSMAGFYNYGSDAAPSNICDVASIPFWVVHGGQDEIVPLAWEQSLVDALTECGGEAQFTIYPDANHDQTFERGFAEPALYAWLLEQHR